MTDYHPPISCYIRTLDEEARIGRTVRAALAVAREVVVVDSGSRDGTSAVAQAEGARVIEQAWLGSGHQKRVGEDACGHDWLLDLDADEVVTDALAEEIRTLFADGEPIGDVYRIPLRYVDPSGRVWRKASPRYRSKLYDRRQIRMPAHDVWDQFPTTRHLRVFRLRGDLLHYAFDGIGHLASKQQAHALRKAPHLNPKSGTALSAKVYAGLPWFFFRSYVLRGRWKEGRYGFMFAMIVSCNHWLRYALLSEQRPQSRNPARGPTSPPSPPD